MPTTVPLRNASVGHYHDAEPQLRGTDSRTWLTRAARAVVAVSECEQGAVLTRTDDDDEYLLVLPVGVRARVVSSGGELESDGYALTIVPPGSSAVTVHDAGTVIRIFSPAAGDLAAMAPNAATYADGAPEVLELPPITPPPGGWRMRNYALADHEDPTYFAIGFRSARLMINFLPRTTSRRDPRKLSPHVHSDYEQVSVALEGQFVHHLRTPWTSDSSTWREDQHLAMGSPSALVIPAGLIHTSQDVDEGVSWLLDVFAPPREDLLKTPGFVRNAGEYATPSA